MWTHLLGGSLELSVSMTVISSVVAFGRYDFLHISRIKYRINLISIFKNKNLTSLFTVFARRASEI